VRKVIVSNLVSLDGFFEGPNRELDWFVFDEELAAYSKELLRSVDTLLFGRVTYQHMAAYWPTAPKEEIAERMNSLHKIVFSRTLESPRWNNSRLTRNNPAEEILKLKQMPGQDMAILGSASLATSLLKGGLIDEYRVILNPVLIGSGNPVFNGMKERLKLKLPKTRLLGSGVVVLYYQTA
jgi:dihydrofolate reductase